MTGGTVVILGEVGDNFGAGFTGGVAFVLDEDHDFEKKVNPETLFWTRITDQKWGDTLRGLVERHLKETDSAYAESLLQKWDEYLPLFWQIVPRDYAPVIGFTVPEAKPHFQSH